MKLNRHLRALFSRRKHVRVQDTIDGDDRGLLAARLRDMRGVNVSLSGASPPEPSTSVDEVVETARASRRSMHL